MMNQRTHRCHPSVIPGRSSVTAKAVLVQACPIVVRTDVIDTKIVMRSSQVFETYPVANSRLMIAQSVNMMICDAGG